MAGHAPARGRAAGACEWAGDACVGRGGLKGGGGPRGPVGQSAGYEAELGACAATAAMAAEDEDIGER